MKQAELRKHLGKQGGRISKRTMRVLMPNYKPPFVDAEVRGLSTNEIKSALAKRGYDVHCPECAYHFKLGERGYRVGCPRCGFRWNVDMYGRPSIFI